MKEVFFFFGVCLRVWQTTAVRWSMKTNTFKGLSDSQITKAEGEAAHWAEDH